MGDRREVHPKESKSITFWEDNKIDREVQKNMGIIISDFLLSPEEGEHREGAPFDRCILAFMARFYGSYDIFEHGELQDLYEIYRFRQAK